MPRCCGYRVPKQVRYVPVGIVVGLIVWLYGSFVWFAQPFLLARHLPYAELAALHIMASLLCASLIQCLRSQDVFVPRHPNRRQAEPLMADDGKELQTIETKACGSRRYCRRCNIWKADRVHHCSTCKRCLWKMDHHCIYINKCIGYYNYKFFLQFLGWASATCLHVASLVFRYLLAAHLDRAVALFAYGRLRFWNPSVQIVLVFFFCACLGLALMCFHFMHLYFTARNTTTLEYCEKRRQPDYVNVFNVGVLQNLQQVLGTYRELPYWFLPVHSPSVLQRGGSSFPVNTKLIKIE